MDVSAPPSLDSACPQAKAEPIKHGHRFMEWNVYNEEYEHEASIFTQLHQGILNSNPFS